MTMAIPPVRGIGLPWILREERARSRAPKRCASRRTSGVRIVPHTIDSTNATAAVFMFPDPPLVLARQDPVAEREDIHARLQVAGQGIAGRRYDRLVLVEAGVEHE